jgi:hypothetical protein
MTNPKYPLENAIYHRAALDSLMQADLALCYAPKLNISEPHHLGDITREWLETTLGADVAGAELEKLVVEDEHSGMTSRRKWGLQWNAAGVAAGLPATIFVKATPDEPYHRETLAVLHMHELEARFYTQIQPEIPTLAPKAWYAKSYAGGRFLILLEDLESSNCKPHWMKDEVGVDHLRAVTRTLATLHATFWDSPRLLTDLSWLRPRTCRFGWPWLSQTMSDVRRALPEKAREHGVYAQILPGDMAATLSLWDEYADRVFAWMDTLPRTVLHGDSHLGNTFSYADGRAGMFDWQVMFSGHGLRDFAYFLFSAIDEQTRQGHEKELFNLYIDTLAGQGVNLDRDEAWNLYCLFILDHWDAASTSIVHGSYNHATAALVRGLTAIAGAIQEHGIGERLRQLIDQQGL